MATRALNRSSAIRLVIADVDGTLLTPEKQLTPHTRAAVEALRGAGIAFAVTSSRPPRGLSMLVAPLGLTRPMAAFNGGMLVRPDLSLIDEQTLPAAAVRQVVEAIGRHALEVWVYRGAEWLVRDPHTEHVRHEARTVGFSPTVMPRLEAAGDGVVKVVGVGDDPTRVARCEAELREELGDRVSASRSQSYYVDVTHPRANKGAAVERLSALLEVPTAQIATIGDMPNDVLMFARSGLSIAMGNASPDVQRTARRVTTANTEEGFANAIAWYVLGDA